MDLSIHRGSNEIGGTCIRLSSGKTTILIDVGMPLVDDGPPATIPNGKIDAVLVSHPHQDHFGLIDLLPSSVPVYTGPIAQELFQATRLFLDKPLFKNNFHTFKAWKQFEIGDFKIIPHLMDHSASDAYAFEVENSGKRLFYSGDFRAHGRKAILFDSLLKSPPKDIDALIMEGTMMARTNSDFPDESSVEEGMVKVLCSDPGLIFLLCSSQNIDRIVSAYRAAKRSDRIFVVDIYTAWILEKISFVSAKSPKINWPSIRVLSKGRTAANHYKTLKNKPEHFGDFARSLYKTGNMITEEEILANPSRYFIKSSFVQRFKDQLGTDSLSVIYSMWLGYLDEKNSSYSYLPKIKQDPGIKLNPIHTSGHAVVEDLKKMVEAIKPKQLIPIHTEHGAKYDEFFPNVFQLQDRDHFII
ncbi:MAG: MBL fold metallo-hydrolase [Desulfobulbaceae bacterium]|nr:MBL fold metallo-hydrolase [Desulfobulbaceae bacterium]